MLRSAESEQMVFYASLYAITECSPSVDAPIRRDAATALTTALLESVIVEPDVPTPDFLRLDHPVAEAVRTDLVTWNFDGLLESVEDYLSADCFQEAQQERAGTLTNTVAEITRDPSGAKRAAHEMFKFVAQNNLIRFSYEQVFHSEWFLTSAITGEPVRLPDFVATLQAAITDDGVTLSTADEFVILISDVPGIDFDFENLHAPGGLVFDVEAAVVALHRGEVNEHESDALNDLAMFTI